jgi:hypothetical protein
MPLYKSSQHSLLYNNKLTDELEAFSSGRFRGRGGAKIIDDSSMRFSYIRKSQQSAASRTSTNINVKKILGGCTHNRGSLQLEDPLTGLFLVPPSEAGWKGRMKALHAETRALHASFEMGDNLKRIIAASSWVPASKYEIVAPKRYSLRHVPTSQITSFNTGAFFFSSVIPSQGPTDEALVRRVYWRYLEYVSGGLISKH